MAKHVSASDAKNNFDEPLEDVAALGRVDILKHGRLVAVMLSPRVLDSLESAALAADRRRRRREEADAAKGDVEAGSVLKGA